MNTQQETVIQNMQIIENTFREVQDVFPTLGEESFVSALEAYPLQFRSIAYEAASMQLALKAIKSNVPLTEWQAFVNTAGAKHAAQCYIGLGWALAQEQLNPSDYLAASDKDIQVKTCDGYGYYDGMFRRRKSVMQMELPPFEGEAALYNYDCGLGRSLWYSHKANAEAVANTIANFPVERRAALWQGFGTAIAYVGGCSKETLEKMAELAGEYKSCLHTGAKGALLSREKAGSVNEYSMQTVDAFSV